MPVRVVHVYKTYFPDSHGGLEEAIRQICLSCKDHGTENRILAISDDPARKIIRREEGRVYRPRKAFEIASCAVSANAFGYFKRLSAWADVIHYHHPWPFADLLHFAAGARKPTVLTYHSDIVRQKLLNRLYNPLKRRFLGAVDRIVCTSPNYFATSDVLGEFASKVDVIPIGIREDSHPSPSPWSLAETERRFGRDFFLFVGVLRYYKGLHILLEAMKRAPYKVVIVGSGPTENELKQQAKRLGLDNVIFAGYLPNDEKINLFKLCRGVVFPSYLRAEAFGVALLEGAMHGKPMISTEIGSGMSHVNVDGRTGFVIPPASPRALREAMDTMHRRPALARRLGAGARNRYEQLFTGELMARQYQRLYEELLGVVPQAPVIGIAAG